MAKKNLKYAAEKIDELLTKADEQMATKTDLSEKVDKVSGKGLSTNDYTTAEKNKLSNIQDGAQKNTVTSVRGSAEVSGRVGAVVISPASIGLGNIENRVIALEGSTLNKSSVGVAGGVASLGTDGRVPSSQLPSYVDDVIDDLNFAQFPATGESGKIYIAKDTNKTYRWSGSGYAEISASLALGETEQTAYSGAKGKKNAEDIAKLAYDLDETHLLASNAESAISEVVELTIPAIEGEVANKATKSEAQGYATTAKNEAITAAATDAQNKANTAESNANDYTDGAVDGLAKGQVATNKANIASLQNAQTSLSATVKTNTDNIATHTQQIANLDSNKLGKTEKAADSAKLGGVAASEYAKSANIPSLASQGKSGVLLFPESSGLTAGWYRIGVTTRTPQQAWTFRMMLRRSFNYNAAETYVIDVAIGYASGSNSNIYFTQVAGGIINARLIDKVRVTVTGSSKSYIDIHIAADCKNNILYLFDGDAEAYASGAIVTGETAATYEFTTVDGMASSHNITAPKFIGAFQGNADSATKLATARKIWGQSFDGTGDVDGDMEVNGDIVIKGNVVIEGSVTSGASYQSNPLATISEDEVPSVEQQLRAQISSLEERIATLEQLIAQNNG